ncbi:two-component system response regulator HydG [Clostridiales Family XIII bacterium PM5-7]
MNSKAGYRILIVDDEQEYQKVVAMILGRAGYTTSTCHNGLEALDYIKENEVSLVITDLRMPKMDGVELIKSLKETVPELDIIVMTAYGSIESAVDAIKYGAKDYFVKSGELEELIIKVERLFKLKRLEEKSNILLRNQHSPSAFLESKNEEYCRILEMCRKTADSGINVLLLGESGVGKEVIANYIHNSGNRSKEPFVPINCQAFPEGVIESELFGHEKGAFTGAMGKRVGKFEEANFGTLFLDEICDLPISSQGKLLRALESRKIERIGSNKYIDLDVRLISATNKVPPEEIEKGTFREDLLYRINTLTVTIPPIRERKEDLPGLIDFFVERIQMEQKKKILSVDDQVMSILLNYDYPGNVRELKNIIERMIALSEGGEITINELPMPANRLIANDQVEFQKNKPLKEARAAFEKSYIERGLRETNGNVAKCSVLLGITTRQLWNKINEYQINPKQ